MKKTLKLCLITIVCAVSFSASARNVWRECGIGGMIFTKTGWAAITSNITWDWGTSATSSHISSEDLCEGPVASVAKFVHQSYAVIEMETVIGNGDHLVAMLDILGCESTVHSKIIGDVRSSFSSALQKKSYGSEGRLDKAKNYHSLLLNEVESKYSSQCHLI